MDKEFYVALPARAKDQTVTALILHALKSVELDGATENDISIEHFYLISPYTDGDKPNIYCSFSAIPKDEIKLRDDNLKLREKYVDATVNEPITFAVPHSPGLPINQFVQRMPLHEEQGNVIRLLRETAGTLQRLDITVVLDLVLHNFLDEDGLEHPYVSVYYST
jgi:hypothetical protein